MNITSELQCRIHTIIKKKSGPLKETMQQALRLAKSLECKLCCSAEMHEDYLNVPAFSRWLEIIAMLHSRQAKSSYALDNKFDGFDEESN